MPKVTQISVCVQIIFWYRWQKMIQKQFVYLLSKAASVYYWRQKYCNRDHMATESLRYLLSDTLQKSALPTSLFWGTGKNNTA